MWIGQQLYMGQLGSVMEKTTHAEAHALIRGKRPQQWAYFQIYLASSRLRALLRLSFVHAAYWDDMWSVAFLGKKGSTVVQV